MYLALDEAAEFIGCYPQLHSFAYRSRENSIDYRGQKEENNYVRRAMTRAAMT